MPLDPEIAALLEMIANSGYPPMYEGTPETARKSYRALTCDWVTPETQVQVGKVEELIVADRPARLYLPEGPGPWPTLVYLHGGGFVIGDLDTHDPLCRLICRGRRDRGAGGRLPAGAGASLPGSGGGRLAAFQLGREHAGELGAGRSARSGW